MTVRYTADYSSADGHLGKMSGGIDAETLLALESALVNIFQATQQAVHVHSGRLRASGRFNSESDGDSWEGEIIYGGVPGVDYAWYEQRRGGFHDFMKVAQGMDSTIGVAFRTGLD